MYFGVSTLLDAASSDGMKADEEQKEVIYIFLLTDLLGNIIAQNTEVMQCIQDQINKATFFCTLSNLLRNNLPSNISNAAIKYSHKIYHV